jgi:hypothetical protein
MLWVGLWVENSYTCGVTLAGWLYPSRSGLITRAQANAGSPSKPRSANLQTTYVELFNNSNESAGS